MHRDKGETRRASCGVEGAIQVLGDTRAFDLTDIACLMAFLIWGSYVLQPRVDVMFVCVFLMS